MISFGLVIYKVQDLKGGSEIIYFSAIDLETETVVIDSPDPSPIKEVAVTIPLTEAFVADNNPTVEIPVRLTLPCTFNLDPDGSVAP